MNENPEFRAFTQVIAHVFAIEPGKIRRETTASDIDGWDSISHATLIMSIEKEYGVTFNDAEIYDPANVGELYDMTKGLLEGTGQ